MKRPKLLFLCQTLPFPPDGGVAIRTYNVLRLLARHYDVTGLFFVRRPVMRDQNASEEGLRSIASVEAFRIDQEHSRSRLIWDHFRSVCTGRVYTYYVHESQDFERALKRHTMSTFFDLIHVDSLDLSRYLSLFPLDRTICVHHNVESELLFRRAMLEKQPIRRAYLRWQAALMRQEEKRYCPSVPLNVMVSRDDAETLQRVAPGSRTTVVPNGVDTDRFAPAQVERQGVVFVGGMTWFPNRDALEWFSRDILPHLRALNSSVHISWVGRAEEDAKPRFEALGIRLTGYVDDIRPHVDSAACYIVPLRVGGGTRLKILDAWALGKAVVSTTVGCEGLEARDGWNILIRDDPKEFAAAVQRVIEDPELQESLGANARATAESLYGWNVIEADMIANYESVRASAVHSTH